MAWPDAAGARAAQAAHEAQLPTVAWFQAALLRLGLSVTEQGQVDGPARRVIAAFQKKYRPAGYHREPDAKTAALLGMLAAATAWLAGGQ